MTARFRLALPPPAPPAALPPPADAPVVFVLPAHDEAASVARVVRRVPPRACGRRVQVIVVDDGSTDDTARLAAEAGAIVLSHRVNLGLGAAIRRGLAEAVVRGAAAVVFCDADEEYAPEEMERLLGPVLSGDADYVVGSRFTGYIERMHPHRRAGNVLLSRWVGWMARRPVTDGQSGYRALSTQAARAAEIVHDYNYAQVLTLDLLAKGFRYAEVPISYRFRREGRSFVRLAPYLRRVLPAVLHEVRGGHRRPQVAPAVREAHGSTIPGEVPLAGR